MNHAILALLLLAQSVGPADLETLKRRLLAGDRVEARETARELLARVVADPQALLNLGQLLGTHQELALAEQAFRQAVRLDPDSYAAQFNLGLTLYQEGKPR